MYLAEIGSNSIIDHHSNLGSRKIDLNHDWVGNARQYHPNLKIADVTTFLQQARNENTIDAENLITDIVDPQTLNKKQMLIFKRIELHYNAMIDHNQIEPLNIIIMETAGTGKSYLIKAIQVDLMRWRETIILMLSHLYLCLCQPELQHSIFMGQQFIQHFLSL